jgi:hypothetical protein
MFSTPDKHLSFEEYIKAADALHVLCGMILFEFARHAESAVTQDVIARNFVARADMMVQGVFKLWEIEDYADCWILHRALLDRLFHLHELNPKGQFSAFGDWSFKIQYEADGRLRSDPAVNVNLAGLVDDVTPEQKVRYQRLVKNNPIWRRPKAEDVAKEMDLTFLYKYGYDFASRYVHPMANDGQQDFHTITHLEPSPHFAEPASKVVLSNSILIASMIIQEALNASTLSWRQVVFEAVEGLRSFLTGASPEHHLALVKVALMFKEKVALAQSQPESATSS